MKHKFFALLLSIVLLLSVMTVVYAHAVPDLSRNGMITFLINWEGRPLEDGEFQMYRVGDIAEDDGNYKFVLVEELSDNSISLDDHEDPILAMQLTQLAKEAGIEPMTTSVEDGKAVFTDVEPGLYAVVQSEACSGFAKMNPFLISMPYYTNGVYETEVVAMPKVPMETEPEEPSEPTTPPEPTEPAPPQLPQTGQLNWPVPLLAAAGLAFFTLGWFLYFRQKREYNET